MNFLRNTVIAFLLAASLSAGADGLERIKYNNPGLVVDLGVGLWAWPLPMDFDGDGDLDLVVVCPDKPYNGTYVFENVSGNVKFPIFKPARRISKGQSNIMASHIGNDVRVLGPAVEFPDFRQTGLDKPVKLGLPGNIHPNRVRSNQWRYVDYNGDGKLDLVVGAEDWTGYGWDRAFNSQGVWTNEPLHGLIYLLRNEGSDYAKPVKIEAGGKPIDGFGMPSPCFADFDGDGDLDLICGEFLDGVTYYENVGTRTAPRYAAGRRLKHAGKPLAMDLEMIVVTAIDWNKDGHVDLVVGQEDGRVALMENTGKTVDGVPDFLPPRFFQQQADDVKAGSLATPCGFDWDGDGKEDIVCGNAAGYLVFFKNLDGDPPRWAAPKYLEADGKVIRIMAGPNGSVQGPAEAKWGYTVLCVADWDGDGLADIVLNSIWGEVLWYRNVSERGEVAERASVRADGTKPRAGARGYKLAAAQPIEVEWPGTPPKPAWNWWNPRGKQLVSQWRTMPFVVDLNHDGLNDLVMLDHEGYLAFFERRKVDGKLQLLPGQRVFLGTDGQPLRLNSKEAGKSGRRKFTLVDWDGDGKLDLLLDGKNVDFWRNVATEADKFVFKNLGPVDARILAGHDTCPTVVHWRGRDVPDLLVGAEDGYLYYLKNPRP